MAMVMMSMEVGNMLTWLTHSWGKLALEMMLICSRMNKQPKLMKTSKVLTF